jgi:hypothetical protein
LGKRNGRLFFGFSVFLRLEGSFECHRGNRGPFFGNQETSRVQIGSWQLFILFFPSRVELTNGGLQQDASLRPLRLGCRGEVLLAALVA